MSVSVDECIENYDKTNYDTDFLNKIESPGIPPHRLALKPNACVILIRTLNLKHRHCNGTRCIIKEIKPHVLRATLLDGGNHSEIFIPKIPLICDNTDFPAKFTRRQFPILGAYYLTFNRAQGQSLDRVGMVLPHSVFTHGQLYTGNSRSGDPNHIFMWADQSELNHCSTIVYCTEQKRIHETLFTKKSLTMSNIISQDKIKPQLIFESLYAV